MAPNKGDYYITRYCLIAAPTAEGVTLEQVKTQLQAINENAVREAGKAYVEMARQLRLAADSVRRKADELARKWHGTTATKALEQMGQLHRTTVELSDKGRAMGDPLVWLGETILPFYREQGTIMDHGHVDDSGDDQAAREMLDRLNHRLVEGHTFLPEKISKDLPPPVESGDIGKEGGGLPPGPGGPGAPPAGQPPRAEPPSHVPPREPTIPTPHSPHDPPVPPRQPDIPDPTPPPVPVPPPDDLPPIDIDDPKRPVVPVPPPSSPDGTDLAGVGGLGGADVSGQYGGGPGSGFGAGAPGGAAPGTAGAGGSGGFGGNLLTGPGGSGTVPTPPGARGAGTPGMGGPMGGHGAGGEEERERNTWLLEDEDVWGADIDLPPPVIQ